MAGFDFPDPTGDWTDDCRSAARAWRRLLKAHPNVMRLFAEQRGPVRTVESMRPTEYALRLLKAGGLSDRDAAQAFHAFGGYIQGFVMIELGSIAGGADAEHLDRHEQLVSSLPEEFPALAAALPHFVECDADQQFEFGLDLLIAGLATKAEAEPTPAP
jgi:hypothetical protein